MSNTASDKKIYKIVFVGVMAAIVFVITYLRIPVGGSKVHLANGFCLISGLLFGPVLGGLAAGLGSAIYDLFMPDQYILTILITFISKFAMAAICALIAGTYKKDKPESNVKIIIGSVVGALSYVALYMLKSLTFGLSFDGLNMQGALLQCASKLPASIINAVAAMIIAPLIYKAVSPSLKRSGFLDKIR